MSFDLDKPIKGRVWKFGDSVETDAINPYYQYPTMEELKLHTLEAYRPEFPKEVKRGDILVAGRNFGLRIEPPGTRAARGRHRRDRRRISVAFVHAQ